MASGRSFSYERRERVGDLLLKEIALIISEGKIRDTRVSRAVITNVSLSRDMSCARVFFTHLKGGSTDSMLDALNGMSGFFRKQVASRLHLKKVPSIEFRKDDVLASAQKVEEIIKGFDG